MSSVGGAKSRKFTFSKTAPTSLAPCIYSVMQSDGNSICEDVVLDRFNMVYSDEDRI